MKLMTFGNMDINDGESYVSSLTATGQVPADMDIAMIDRTHAAPVIGTTNRPARYLVIETHIPATAAASKRTLQAQWYTWFAIGVKRQLVIADDNGSNLRYVWAAPFTIQHDAGGDGWSWQTMLAVDGDGDPDYAWRTAAATTYSWNITTSGDTLSVVNGTADSLDAYPVITIAPTVQEGAGDSDYYTRFITVRWRASAGMTNYPVNITNATLDTQIASTNFLDADGDDIRVYVDGTDTDYWLNGANTNATSIWCNLNFQAQQTTTLASGVDAGALTTLTASGDISGFPLQGILLIGSELFEYSGKSGNTFTGVTREMYGTTAASHSAAATVEWIQHNIILEYGTAAAAKVTDDDYKPIFKLSTSTNTSWVYEEFYEDAKSRSGAWTYQDFSYATKYGGDRGATASPYVEMGIYLPITTVPWGFSYGTAHWYLFNPCGITAANFTNGEKRPAWVIYWQSQVRSSINGSTWTTVYSIPAGITNSTWASWSHNATSLTAGTRYLSLFLSDASGSTSYWTAQLEVADCTVTLDSNYTPAITIGGELEPAGRVRATLTNTTTGESLDLSFTAFEDGDSLEIDVDNYTVTRVSTGGSMYSAVTTDAVRRYMLRLAAGTNVLSYVDAELVEVDVDISFAVRSRV